MHGGTQQHLGANPVLLVSGIKRTLPGQGRVRRSESILTDRRQGIRYSCEAGPFNPFLEAWICLRVLFANHRPVNGVHENPVWPENGLVANARQLCLSPNQRFCGVAQLDRQLELGLHVLKTNLRYAAVVVVPPRAPAIRPREKALQKSQLKEGYVDQKPGLEQNG